MLGSPLIHEAIVPILDLKIGDIRRLCSKLEEVELDYAFIYSRIFSLLRTCPTFLEPKILADFDSNIRAALLPISNVS